MKDKTIADQVGALLSAGGVISSHEQQKFQSLYALTPFSADGSCRNFFRVRHKDKSLCIGVYPADDSPANLAEACSAIHIGRHLYSHGIPVPVILGANEETGLILFEDCGDVRLHDALAGGIASDTQEEEQLKELFQSIVGVLARMQSYGSIGFQKEWCHDSPEYDRETMITRESSYFLEEFWYGLLGGEQCHDIEEEFEDIASQAGTGEQNLFLHRDFQCRNIMLQDLTLKIIDFQGGRIGPPGYDLASLLIDPYSAITPVVQEELLDFYLVELAKYRTFDRKDFLRQYSYLFLQRNLQILGAFSFLYRKRDKPFFKQYLRPALNRLAGALEKPELRCYGRLRKVAIQANELLSF
ncbi:MAG: phosphotransferase [Desulfopila sp.]|jgi:aminoglycoside/choline kinase family phosphotransferase|nr:phosphotransferase [Desulfopila sp.]